MLSVRLAKIVGISNKKSWSQVHTFLPDDPPKKSRRGQLLAAISLANLSEEMDPVVVGREIISRLHEEYYGNLEGNPFEKLKGAVAKVVVEVGSGAEIEIAAAVLLKNVLYLTILGQGKAILRRNEKIATILAGPGNASGYLKNGDLFFLGTSPIFKTIDEKLFRKALTKSSLTEIKDSLTSFVHTQSTDTSLAGLIIQVRGKKPSLKFNLKSPLKNIITLLGSKTKTLFLKWRRIAIHQSLSSIREKPRVKRSQKTAATVVLILLFLLGISVILGQWQKGRSGQKQQVAAVLEKAKNKREEGEALLELNPLKAKELLLEAQGILQELEGIESSPQNLIEFQKELEISLAQVMHEHQVEAKVFFDLELIKAGASGEDWDLSAEKLVILDRGKSTVYSLGLKDKQSAILAGGEKLVEADHVAAFLPQTFILTKKGILENNQETKKQELVIEIDDDWRKITDLRAFGGNLYLLEKSGRIWKYTASESGFGAKNDWLESNPPDPLETASMAIDGAVWVLTVNGKIFKYVRGMRDAFGIAGLDKPFLNPMAIYTDADQEKIYILDRGHTRVVVLAKSGEYDSQYSWEGLKNASDLIASEKEKKIFVLNGSKIYEIEMK